MERGGTAPAAPRPGSPFRPGPLHAGHCQRPETQKRWLTPRWNTIVNAHPRGPIGTINLRRTISRPPFSEQPLCELAHLRLAGGEARFDDEIRTRSNQRLFERRDESARFDEIADQRLTAERHALAADRRLDH